MATAEQVATVRQLWPLLAVEDIGRSIDFYQNTLRFTIVGRGVAFYFVCDDVEQLHAELSSRGIQLDPVTVAEYGMKQLFVPEPDGYSVCFESPTDT